jgi:transcription antitermination factor NusG
MTDEGWVILRTRAHDEALAARAIAARGVQSYNPLLDSRDGRRPGPLFPGYLFAYVAAASDDVLRIRSAPGIAYMLPRHSQPTYLPETIVESIRQRLSDACVGQPDLRPGDRVTVVSGPFQWLDAIFDRRLSATGRVRILLELAHSTLRLSIDQSALKRA